MAYLPGQNQDGVLNGLAEYQSSQPMNYQSWLTYTPEASPIPTSSSYLPAPASFSYPSPSNTLSSSSASETSSTARGPTSHPRKQANARKAPPFLQKEKSKTQDLPGIHGARRRKRIEQLQREILQLKAMSWEAEQQNRLTPEFQSRWNRLFSQLKSEMEKDSEQQEAIGWLLKHAYGTAGAKDRSFSAFLSREESTEAKSDCTLS